MNGSSMLYWWPRVKHLDIPMPRTEIILQKESKEWIKVLNMGALSRKEHGVLKQTAANIGYPCFMKTDMFSSKHNYLTTCHVTDESALYANLFTLATDSYLNEIEVNAIVLREHLDLIAPFNAFQDLPIAKERRYFAEDGQIMNHQPYWPEEAITHSEQSPLTENWKEELQKINHENPDEIKLLSHYASRLSRELDGPWSFDFAQATDGTWYFIEAARAIDSYLKY